MIGKRYQHDDVQFTPL